MHISGRRIRERRCALGLSQQQLAGKDLTRSFISLIEMEKAQPSPSTLKLIAQRLDKPPEYFMESQHDAQLDAITLLEKAAQRFMAEKRWDEALLHANSALQLVERMGQLDSVLRLRMQVALCSLCKRDLDASLDQYEAIIDECQASGNRTVLVEAEFYLAMTYQQLEDYANARRHYQHVIRHSAGKKSQLQIRASAMVNVGSCLGMMGRLGEAIHAFLEATKTILPSESPTTDANACMGLGLAYKKERRWQESLTYSVKALEVFQQCGSIQAVNCRHTLACIHLETGQLEDALSDLMDCLSDYRSRGLLKAQADVLATLALYHLKRKEPEQAIASCEEALNLLDVQDDGIVRGVIYRRMAQVYLDRDLPDRARDMLRISVDLLRRLRAHDEMEESLTLLTTVSQ